MINRSSRDSPEDAKPARPTLQIPIPHYRLGTPQFTGKGSVILQSTVHSPSEAGTSRLSGLSTDPQNASFPQPPKHLPRPPLGLRSSSQRSERPRHLAVNPMSQRRTVSTEHFRPNDRLNPDGSSRTPPTSVPNRSLEMQIRRSPSSGHILAATTAQLIAQITSSNLLDYELLSDFFLTFRVFLTPHELISRLADRLSQSLRATDDSGRIVRVRTFVALRHWVLNYFLDDFIGDYSLRHQFCEVVNNLSRDLLQDGRDWQGDLKILTELKRCWKHTCGLYWDMPDPEDDVQPHDDISPGGHLGSRASKVESTSQLAYCRGSRASKLDLSTSSIVKSIGGQDGHNISNFSLNATERLATSDSSGSWQQKSPGLRESDQSAQALSCSVPASFWPGFKQGHLPAMGPRPLEETPHGQAISAPPSAARKPRKRNHNRSGSFSDSIRDDRAPLPEPKAADPEDQSSVPIAFPGALIRGAFVHPFPPYVDSLAPPSPSEENSTFDFSVDSESDTFDVDGKMGIPNSPGNPSVRRFIGSVRRVLSARQGSPRADGELNHEQHRRKRSFSRERPSFARSEQSRGPPKRKLVAGRAQVRVDLLAAETVEMFRAAVAELSGQDHGAANGFEAHQPSSAHASHSVPFLQHPRNLSVPPRLNGAVKSDVTLGSRSIVIVDDTAAGDFALSDGEPAERMTSTIADEIAAMGNSNGVTDHENPNQVQAVPIYLDSPMTPTTREAFGSRSSSPTAPSESETSEAKHTPPSGKSHRRNVSLRKSDSQGLRKLASLQSGMTQVSAQQSGIAAKSLPEASEASLTDPFNLETAPANQLRRRPGGDLRAVDHVHDLNDHSSSRSSDGSSSRTVSVQIPPRKSSTNAPQAWKENAGKHDPNSQQSAAIQSTDSKPVLNPSFEREVEKLAELPDNEFETGVDAALRKLEGDAEVEGPSPIHKEKQRRAPEAPHISPDFEDLSTQSQQALKRHRRGDEVVELLPQDEESTSQCATPTLSGPDTETSQGLTPTQPHFVVQSRPYSVAESEDSYSSIPLLERRTSHSLNSKTPDSEWMRVSHANKIHGPVVERSAPETDSEGRASSGRSLAAIERTESLGRMPSSAKSKDVSPVTHESFLLDEDQSSLSSVTPDDATSRDDQSQAMHSFYDDAGSVNQDVRAEDQQAETPRRSSLLWPPDPAITAGPELQPPSENVASGPYVSQKQPAEEKRLSRTRSADDVDNVNGQGFMSNVPTAAHLPFILAYDSFTLAQQLTLLEKDALAEVEWRDLIDLRWNQAPSKLNSWVEYLKTLGPSTDRQGIRCGIDLCIARFNIMVKWTRSEIVMTQDVRERASAIVKYIHISHHARRLKNWATMYQITMALIGADCSRLKQTWALVPDRDRETLKALEMLILPTRNFYNLRREMETATAESANADLGCIPFIGIYTHDLIYNAQKPAFIKSGVDAEDSPGLVNFDRHHSAAMIVKNLLRMIEASSKYNFQPLPEVESRCLWMASLTDEEITRRSLELEPPTQRSSH